MQTQVAETPAWRRAWCAALLACVPTIAPAIAPDVRLADLHRTEWSRLQGAPAGVETAVVASDGMVWLIGSSGVHRFDGVRFHAFAPGGEIAAADATTTAADRDGGLWLAQSNGDVLHIRGRSLQRHAPVKGLHKGVIAGLAVAADGRVWAASRAGVSLLENGRWRGFADAPGVPSGQVDGVAVDPDGRVWLLASDGVYVGDADGTRFTREEAFASGASHMRGIVAGAHGVWRWDAAAQGGNLCRVMPAQQRGCWDAEGLLFPQFDAHGALWWGSGEGLWRLREPAALGSDPDDLVRLAEHVPAHAHALAFGIDGSLWSVESNTLTRLRETALRPASTPSGALAPAGDGSVWVGSFTRGLMRVGTPPADTPLLRANDDTLWTDAAAAASADLADMMTFEPLDAPPPPGTAVVLARHPEARGGSLVRLDPMRDGGVRLLTLSPPRLVEFDGARARSIDLPALERGVLMRGTQQDARGGLWLAAARNPVSFFRLQDGVWSPHGGVAGVDKNMVNGFALDGETLWVAVGKNQVGRARDGAWTPFGPEHGLELGMAIQPTVHDGQVWVAGTTGFQGVVGERFVSIVGHDGDRFVGATGVQQVDSGDLWLHGVAGISRIERSEWERALRDPSHRVAYARFDHLDGNMASAMQGAPLPALVQASDGVLWAATDGVLLRLDPARLPPVFPPPQVQLLSLHADGVEYALDGAVALPVGARQVALRFAAPPVDVPERSRVRYRLAGRGDWIDAGDRREVVYEALPPGDHVFEVAASDREGRWSDTPTRLAFTLPPRFHQTAAFRVLLALCAAAVLAGLYALRVRQVAEHARRETTARLHERMRISRDLHDTLLQSVQALNMHVQAISARVPDGDPLRQRIDLVLERAQDAIREGRDRISALRDPLAGTSDLGETLQRIAQRLARDADVACEVHVDAPRALQPEIYDELLHIGREALVNAMQHARATRVRLHVAFADDGVTVRVIDDGAGVPDEVLQQGGRDGHFGLRGMRERAALAGAELRLRNADDRGAEVAIHVPAQRAYPTPPGARRTRRDGSDGPRPT